MKNGGRAGINRIYIKEKVLGIKVEWVWGLQGVYMVVGRRGRITENGMRGEGGMPE